MDELAFIISITSISLTLHGSAVTKLDTLCDTDAGQLFNNE